MEATPIKYEFDLDECAYALKYAELDYEQQDDLKKLVNLQLAYQQGWSIVPVLNSFYLFDPMGTRQWHQAGTWTPVFGMDSIHERIPNYFYNTGEAFSLFEGIKSIELMIHPMGFDRQWKVGYKFDGFIYLPGSGSYYDLPEAVTRAYIAFLSRPTRLE